MEPPFLSTLRFSLKQVEGVHGGFNKAEANQQLLEDDDEEGGGGGGGEGWMLRDAGPSWDAGAAGSLSGVRGGVEYELHQSQLHQCLWLHILYSYLELSEYALVHIFHAYLYHLFVTLFPHTFPHFQPRRRPFCPL